MTTTYSGIPTVHAFTGSTNVVNRNSATAPFGRGWQLSGLDQPLVDHLGTVRDLAKQDGTIAAHYKYDSFGNVTSGDAIGDLLRIGVPPRFPRLPESPHRYSVMSDRLP